MEQKSSTKITSKKISQIIILIILAIIFGWAGLTKAGYIPNFLDIKILCPEDETDNFPSSANGLNDNFHAAESIPAKPIIYLYPEKKQDVTVKLDYAGIISAAYPKYDDIIHGWKVTAYPDGKIINHDDNKEYSYLFWEGISNQPINWDLSQGFVVKGEDTREFLQGILAKIGLTPEEYNEFIVYWYPKMKDNKYNLIHFADEQYAKTAPLTITPKPDSILRVFMIFKALNEKIEIEPQIFQPFERKGFTVVEWGGEGSDPNKL
mgnify:CR=1 FL=1